MTYDVSLFASQLLTVEALRRPVESTQYAADAYQRVLRDHAIVCSMSRKGDCWDNAVTESFFATLKTELIHRQPWPTRRGAKDAVAEYLEGFYNPYRLHSSLGYVSPNDYERVWISLGLRAEGYNLFPVTACEVRPEPRKTIAHVHGP